MPTDEKVSDMKFTIEAPDTPTFRRMHDMVMRQQKGLKDLTTLNPVIAGFFRFHRELFGGSFPEFLGAQIALALWVTLIEVLFG